MDNCRSDIVFKEKIELISLPIEMDEMKMLVSWFAGERYEKDVNVHIF